MKIQLIEDWRKAWRFLSVQAMGLNAAFLASWTVIPDDFKMNLPKWFMPVVVVSLLLTGIIGRIVKQNS